MSNRANWIGALAILLLPIASIAADVPVAPPASQQSSATSMAGMKMRDGKAEACMMKDGMKDGCMSKQGGDGMQKKMMKGCPMMQAMSK